MLGVVQLHDFSVDIGFKCLESCSLPLGSRDSDRVLLINGSYIIVVREIRQGDLGTDGSEAADSGLDGRRLERASCDGEHVENKAKSREKRRVFYALLCWSPIYKPAPPLAPMNEISCNADVMLEEIHRTAESVWCPYSRSICLSSSHMSNMVVLTLFVSFESQSYK